MEGITKSVGRGGVNLKGDVERVQKWLNLAVYGATLKEDGAIGPGTIGGIDYFQAHDLKIKPDGRIDPDGATVIALRNRAESPQCTTDSIGLPAAGTAAALGAADFATAAATLGCEVAAIKAVTEVESQGAGFLASKRPKILFEAHIFSRLTYHVFDKTYPDISSKTWNKQFYKGNEEEYPRLMKAMAVNRQAALKSASWGMFQIMGFNHEGCGYGSVELFVQAMFESEGKHLRAFCAFLKKSKLDGHLKTKNWASFAAGYNGPAYAENKYDTKMATAYKKFSGAK
jgi:hypothetical protein